MNKLLFRIKLARAKRSFKKGNRGPIQPNPLDYVEEYKLRKHEKDFKGLVVLG